MFSPIRKFWCRYFTPVGSRFILLTLGSGVAAINTGNNLLYLVLAMMLSLIIASGILARQTLRGIAVERLLPPAVHAGAPVLLRYRFHNRKRTLPSYSLTVEESDAPIVPPPGYLFHIAAGAAAEVTAGFFAFPRRGRMRLGVLHLRTTFPFGLLRKQLRVPNVERDVIVYPRLAQLPPQAQAAQAATRAPLAGSHEARRGEGIELRNLRRYVSGDDARSIHWKASARSGQLLLKEFERDEAPRARLVLINGYPDAARPPGPEARDRFERAVVLAASLANDLSRHGLPVALWTAAASVPLGHGREHLLRIFELLALVQPLAISAGAAEARRWADDGAIVIVPWYDPAWTGSVAPGRILDLSAPDLRDWWPRPQGAG